MRTDDKPRAKTQEHFAALAYSNSPYKNPIIGWPSDIENYTIADLEAWYKKWYAPNNATLVVVGDVEPKAVFAMAEKYFGPLQPSQIDPVKPQQEVEQLGMRRMTVNLPDKLPYLVMGYKVPVLKTADQDWEAYALEVMAGILDGGSSARLESGLVRGKQIAVAAGAGYGLTSRLDDLFMLDATPAQGKTHQELESALKEEIEKLKYELVDPEELQRIKAQVRANAIYERDSMFYQGMQMGIMETIGLGWQKADEYVEKVNQVTAEQIREVARKYFTDDNLSVAYLVPQPIGSKDDAKKTKERK